MSVYVWGLMERSYNGWPIVCAQVAVFYPGIVLSIFTLLNLVIYHTGAESYKIYLLLEFFSCIQACAGAL